MRSPVASERLRAAIERNIPNPANEALWRHRAPAERREALYDRCRETRGDPVWLERARAFAMHAIGQGDRMRQEFGRGRYSLWTGDPGVAVYLWHCLTGGSAVPSLDTLDC